jgi:hypothetical protein
MCAHGFTLPPLSSEWGSPEKSVSAPPQWPPLGLALCRERVSADLSCRRLPDEMKKLKEELADASSLDWKNKKELEQELEKTRALKLLEEEFRRAHDPPTDDDVLRAAASTFAAVQYYLSALSPTEHARSYSFLLELAWAQRSAALAAELASEPRTAKALQTKAAVGMPLTVCTGPRAHHLPAGLGDRVDPHGEVEPYKIPSISFTPLGCLRIVPTEQEASVNGAPSVNGGRRGSSRLTLNGSSKRGVERVGFRR